MESLLKQLPSVKTLFMLAAFCGVIVYALKDTLVSLAMIGDNEALSLILFFLAFFFLSILGIAGFYAISKKEIDAESSRKNIAKVSGSKKVKGKQKGEGGYIDIEDSEEIELEQDSNENLSDSIDKKKG